MFFNYRLFFQQFFRSLFPGGRSDLRFGPNRMRFFVFFFILFPWLWFFAYFGFLLDRIFFPGFRRQPVRRPVFILGNFRSGSTMLQRLLARDRANFSAIRSWEIYTAPSISQRRMIQGIKTVDRWFGSPLYKRIMAWEERVLRQVKIHRIGVYEPEEDEGLFFYIWYSLFIWFFFPTSVENARFDRFDEVVREPRKRRIMRFYRNCIKRHLYARSRQYGRHYLSKNPSHTGRIDALLKEFPDARIIYLLREPDEMISSSLSWFSFCWNYFTDPADPYAHKELILEMAEHFYSYPLQRLAAAPPENRLVVRYEALTGDVEKTVQEIYRHFGLTMTDEFRRAVSSAARRSRAYKSRHNHTLENARVSESQVENLYRKPYRKFLRGLEKNAR
jgi:hypothetical protein